MNKRDELEKMRAHERVWKRFSRKVDKILGALGQGGSYDDGADFWIVENDWGGDAIQIDLRNLDLLRPDVLDRLQASLGGNPDWSITISISLRDRSHQAPSMGLIIYSDEIIDELQRDYLPERFRHLVFGKLATDIKNDIEERVRQLMNKPPAGR